MSLDFYQIIYDDAQRNELYPFAKVHLNTDLTIYFENSVIASLVPASNADYISVCSWRLREKRGSGMSEVILNRQELTEEKILCTEFDIAVLTPRSKSHHIMNMGSNWHGKAWDDAIGVLRQFIKIPEEIIGDAIYENHFIARREIYHEYVRDVLVPCMAFMDGHEVFLAPSGYINKVKDRKKIESTLSKLQMNDWPIAPFILERLFRIWIEGKRFNIVNL